ncbi:hypothetical protein, partial [Pseudomonas mosselii]|uniref:hypothetical protein n=1 Tax=Pseudomonas mosselii TaxID=78327 RepID=UPI002022DD1C
IEFYGFPFRCQALIQKNPFLFKPLASQIGTRLSRDGACRPIVPRRLFRGRGMGYYLYEFTVVAVVHVPAQDHPH